LGSRRRGRAGGQPQERAVVEAEQVEDVVEHRHPPGEALHRGLLADVHPLLQPAEAGPALLVERHQLTVHHQ
jgi:hypothetical protein